MINNLEELANILKKEEINFSDPRFRQIFQFYLNGISAKGCTEILSLMPSIPLNYLDVISLYNCHRVAIGMFNVSPSVLDPTLVEALIAAYEDPFFPKEFMERHNIYQIGSYNTDLLCVTSGTEKFQNGEILFVEEGYDIYHPEDSQIHPIAKDFEQFLIIAGNWNQLMNEIVEDDSNYKEKKQEFLERLRLLKVDEKYYEIWMSLF